MAISNLYIFALLEDDLSEKKKSIYLHASEETVSIQDAAETPTLKAMPLECDHIEATPICRFE